MIKLLFPTPINISTLKEPTHLIYDEVGFLLNKGYTNKVISGVNGDRIDITNEFFEKENLTYIPALLNNIQKNILSFCKEICIKPQYITESWININPTNSYNKRHCHPGSVISGTYYIKYPIDADSPICFYRSREFSDYGWTYAADRDVDELKSYYSHHPCENELIMFPSYLDHDVVSNHSNDSRVSLAFNTSP